MTSPISIWIRNADGSARLGESPTFPIFCDRDGVDRPHPPAFDEIGDGEYRADIRDDDDVAVGSIGLVDCGAGCDPGFRYQVVVLCDPLAPFAAWAPFAADGSLSSGAPTVSPFRSLVDAADRTPPAVVKAGAYELYSVTPSGADLSVGVTGVINPPANVYPVTEIEFDIGGLSRTPVPRSPPPPDTVPPPGQGFIAEAYARQLVQLLPPGPAWEASFNSETRKLMLAVSEELARVDARGVVLIAESDPRTATETIADWERVLQIPDERVTEIPATLGERRIAVTQKLIGRAGQNVAYFMELAASCGYPLQPFGFLETPVISSVVRSSTVVGALASSADYSYRVTAINDYGQSLGSARLGVHLPAGTATNRVRVSWSRVIGATGYRIYGRDGSDLLIAEVGDVTLFEDLGTLTPAGSTPPLADTATTEPITKFVSRMARVGRMRCGDHVGARVGAVYAYAMQLNILPVVGTVLPQADFERVIRHATHSHITVIFNYL